MFYFNEYYILGMFFSSIIFWKFVPEEHKHNFLFTLSAISLAAIQPIFTLFLFLLVLFVYHSSKLIKSEGNLRFFTLVIIILIIALLGFKYIGVIFEEIFGKENSFSASYLIPIGISYLCFKLIAYVIDIYRGTITNPELKELLLFIFFIPTFPAGPIEKYQNFAGKRNKTFSWDMYSEGLKRIVYGYFKKVVLVNFALNELVFNKLYPIVSRDGVNMDLSSSIIIVYLIGALLYAYLDLSSYADLAIGFGLLFGYRICENMNYPILARNIGDYWTRWHISLSNWCRNNVYFPTLGWSRSNAIALYSSFFVMGMWHYVNLNWLFWSLWHATGILVFKKWEGFKRKYLKTVKMPALLGKTIGIIITVIYASMGYSFITMESSLAAWRLILALFL